MPQATPKQQKQAFENLPKESWLRLYQSAQKYNYLRHEESGGLVGEAYIRHCDGRRNWNSDYELILTLKFTMMSVASEWYSAQKKSDPEAYDPDVLDQQPSTMMNPEQLLVHMDCLAEQRRIYKDVYRCLHNHQTVIVWLKQIDMINAQNLDTDKLIASIMRLIFPELDLKQDEVADIKDQLLSLIALELDLTEDEVTNAFRRNKISLIYAIPLSNSLIAAELNLTANEVADAQRRHEECRILRYVRKHPEHFGKNQIIALATCIPMRTVENAKRRLIRRFQNLV